MDDMEKYIDVDRLRSEIELRINELDEQIVDIFDSKAVLRKDECQRLLSVIDSLQQEQLPEVDIVTEYDEQFYSDPVFGKLANRNAGIAIARHFYELGLNARCEE